MQSLPNDIILNDLWFSLPYEDIIIMCATKSQFYEIYQLNITWILLLERDFGIHYKGLEAHQQYKNYYSILKYFSKSFPIITSKAIEYISNMDKKIWSTIIEQHEKLAPSNKILEIGIISTLLDEGGVNIGYDKYLRNRIDSLPIKQILNSNCDTLLQLITIPTRIFINKRPIIVKYDLDLAFEYFVILQSYYDMDCYSTIKYLNDYLLALL